jgi:hypothetical protein
MNVKTLYLRGYPSETELATSLDDEVEATETVPTGI